MSLEGAGPHRFWGFSPAVDLFAEAAELPHDDDDDAPLRALLVCASDPRHIFHTLAATCERRAAAGKGTAAERALEVCVFEREPEVLARQMLLLSIALDFELPRRERAELLLEVWANTLLREKTAAYVASRAHVLSRVLSDEEGPLAPIFDFNALKSRDRDALEAVLRSWGEDVPFAAVKARDERLRGFYKNRYDSRRNVLDWDYTWELKPIASIVHKIHFREWRLTGVAFEVKRPARLTDRPCQTAPLASAARRPCPPPPAPAAAHARTRPRPHPPTPAPAHARTRPRPPPTDVACARPLLRCAVLPDRSVGCAGARLAL